jgi:hypothetical protein
MAEIRTVDDPRLTPVMLRRELLGEGWNDKAIARMVRAGVWARPRHGAYVDASAWRSADHVGRHEIRARAVLAQTKASAALCMLSAASVWDLSFWGDLPLDTVHTLRSDMRSGRREAGVAQHHGTVQDGDLTMRHDVPVVAATRLGLELPTVVDLEHALCFVNELLRRNETTVDELRDRYESMVRWPHSLKTDLVLKLAHGKCQSVGENRFWYLCWRQHLPRPEPQYEVRDPVTGEVVAELDFAWPDHGVFAEFDGKVKYTRLLLPGQSPGDVVLAEKAREDLVRELTGWRAVRVDWADLGRPEHTAARVRRAFASALADRLRQQQPSPLVRFEP